MEPTEITPSEALLRVVTDAQNIAKLLSNAQNETHVAMPVPLPERILRFFLRRFYKWMGWKISPELSADDVTKIVSTFLNLANQTEVLVKCLIRANIDVSQILNHGEVRENVSTSK